MYRGAGGAQGADRTYSRKGDDGMMGSFIDKVNCLQVAMVIKADFMYYDPLCMRCDGAGCPWPLTCGRGIEADRLEVLNARFKK